MKPKLLPVILLLFISLLAINSCKKRIQPLKKERPSEISHLSMKKLLTGKRGGSLIRADIQELDSFNIVTTRSPSVYNVLKLVFDSLITIDPYTGKITGSIAKDYKISNNGLSIILYLNNNIYFSDGKKCTADDVIYTFDKIYMNPEVDSKKIETLTIRNKLIKIKKIDSFTVRFDLPVPYRPFLYTLTQLEILPEHILKPEIEKKGIEWFNKKWGSIKSGKIQNIVGTGPYKIAEYKKGKYIKLIRNPYYGRREGCLYLKDMPYIDTITELLNIDNDTKILKFEIGEIDFYDVNETDFKNGNIESLIKNREEGKYHLCYSKETLKSNHFLVFNQNPEAIKDKELSALFRDKRFREAVSLCINRKEISRLLYKGYASESLSPIRDSSPYYKKQPLPLYDPTKSKEILKNLGLTDNDGDGILNFPSGKNVTFTILTNKDNPIRIKIGNMLISYLKKIGIKANVETTDYSLLITKLLDNFRWEAVIIGSSGSIEPNDLSWIWESNGTLHIWYPYQSKPATQWEKRIDELLAMGRTTWDITKAKSYYYEFQDIAISYLPIINIVTPFQIYGYRNGLENVFPSPVTFNNIGILPYIFQK